MRSTYLFSGEFHESAVDLHIRGRGLDFVWARKYRSRIGPNTGMGNGWDFSYNKQVEAAGSHLRLHDGNTRADLVHEHDGHSRLAAAPGRVPGRDGTPASGPHVSPDRRGRFSGGWHG